MSWSVQTTCRLTNGLHFDLRLPEGQAGEFRIPFDCWLDERYLGSYLACTVRVLPG